MCYVLSTALRILHTQYILTCKSSQQSYGVYEILSLLTDEAMGTEKLCNVATIQFVKYIQTEAAWFSRSMPLTTSLLPLL